MAIEYIGILNDDSNPVGQVHAGLVLLLKGDSADIKIRSSELKSGVLATRDECLAHKDRLESWSQMVVEYLVAKIMISRNTGTTSEAPA